VSDDRLQPTKCAEKLKALGEPMRLRIVDRLRSGPLNVGELAVALEAEVVTVSHHLGVLRTAGLVVREKQGRFAVYRLEEGLLDSDQQNKLDLGCCSLEMP
jgi:DNA-binding transcriptional ArsR family regulator